jgi:hypothetical protein
MNLRSILELDARVSEKMRVAEKPGALRSIAVFLPIPAIHGFGAQP